MLFLSNRVLAVQQGKLLLLMAFQWWYYFHISTKVLIGAGLVIVQPHSVFSSVFLQKERRGTARANFPTAKGVLTYLC